MFGYLILLFTILPAIELALLIHIGTYLGAPNTILVIIFTGVLGAYLARLQGFLVIRNIQRQLEQGKMPTEEMLDGLMIFVGGIVLLTPGFITDLLGFLLLIPWTRLLIKTLIRKKFDTTIHKEDPSAHQSNSTYKLHDNADDADFY